MIYVFLSYLVSISHVVESPCLSHNIQIPSFLPQLPPLLHLVSHMSFTVQAPILPSHLDLSSPSHPFSPIDLVEPGVNVFLDEEIPGNELQFSRAMLRTPPAIIQMVRYLFHHPFSPTYTLHLYPL